MSDSLALHDTTRPLRVSSYGGPWHLELVSSYDTRSLPLHRGQSVVIGTGRGVDVRVHDRTVSQRHVELLASDDGLRVRDLGSTNGTFVGSARIRRAVLAGRSGTIVIGRTTVAARCLDSIEHDPGEHCIPGLVGRSLVVRRLAADIKRFATLQAPVLLMGETGTGKEVVARALHRLSQRKDEFVAVNVGGLNEALADAELFGHRRGAFTGAVGTRTGAFEEAGSGTLFLDEIADLSLSIQVKLLRVLEERQVKPLGGGSPIPVGARIVSACWAALDELAERGEFRVDLYHRLSTIVLHVPPLRQRKTDIGVLSAMWLDRYEAELGPKCLSPRGLARLVEYDWPGNVRELGGVVYRAAALTTGKIIDTYEVEQAIPSGVRPSRKAMDVEEAERYLERHGNNVSAAARSLGVARSTFRSWLRKKRQSHSR